MTNEYDWYFKAFELGGGRQLTRDQQQALGVTHEPQAGFYRKRNKHGADVPVAIWVGEMGMVAVAGNDPVDPVDIWTWVCSWPVGEEVYRDVAENGKSWPGSDPIVAVQVANIGHNSDQVDEAEAFADQVAAAEKGKDAYTKITDDEQLASAQSLRSRLLELAGEGEKKHKREKEPHLEAGRAVDKRWLPVVKRARAAADDIKAGMSAYETAKLRKQREIEAARLAAEIAVRKAEQAKNPEQPPIPVGPEAEPVAPTPIRGSYGRAASVSVVNVVTAITDQDALYRFLRDHPDLKNCMFDLAKRAVAKGHTVPGVTVEEVAKVA